MVLDFDEDAGSQAFDLIPALGGSAESKNFLASRHDLFMILAEMVQKGRQTVFESLFTDLGFGAGSQEQVSKNKPACVCVPEGSGRDREVKVVNQVAKDRNQGGGSGQDQRPSSRGPIGS